MTVMARAWAKISSLELISANQINLFNLANWFIYKPVVVELQAPRRPFGSILPSSSVTAATTKTPTCPACPVVLFASQFWRAAYVRYFPARAPVLPPRTVPVLSTGLLVPGSPCSKGHSVECHREYSYCSTAVLQAFKFSQSAIQHWLKHA